KNHCCFPECPMFLKDLRHETDRLAEASQKKGKNFTAGSRSGLFRHLSPMTWPEAQGQDAYIPCLHSAGLGAAPVLHDESRFYQRVSEKLEFRVGKGSIGAEVLHSAAFPKLVEEPLYSVQLPMDAPGRFCSCVTSFTRTVERETPKQGYQTMTFLTHRPIIIGTYHLSLTETGELAVERLAEGREAQRRLLAPTPGEVESLLQKVSAVTRWIHEILRDQFNGRSFLDRSDFYDFVNMHLALRSGRTFNQYRNQRFTFMRKIFSEVQLLGRRGITQEARAVAVTEEDGGPCQGCLRSERPVLSCVERIFREVTGESGLRDLTFEELASQRYDEKALCIAAYTEHGEADSRYFVVVGAYTDAANIGSSMSEEFVKIYDVVQARAGFSEYDLVRLKKVWSRYDRDGNQLLSAGLLDVIAMLVYEPHTNFIETVQPREARKRPANAFTTRLSIEDPVHDECLLQFLSKPLVEFRSLTSAAAWHHVGIGEISGRIFYAEEGIGSETCFATKLIKCSVQITAIIVGASIAGVGQLADSVLEPALAMSAFGNMVCYGKQFETGEWLLKQRVTNVRTLGHEYAGCAYFNRQRRRALDRGALSLDAVAEKDTFALCAGGDDGRLILHRRTFLGGQTLLHSGEGPINQVRWRASLIAWGNEKGATPKVVAGYDGDSVDAPMGITTSTAMIVFVLTVSVRSVKVYNTATSQKVTYVPRPPGGGRVTGLLWISEDQLAMSWSSVVKLAVILPAEGSNLYAQVRHDLPCADVIHGLGLAGPGALSTLEVTGRSAFLKLQGPSLGGLFHAVEIPFSRGAFHSHLFLQTGAPHLPMLAAGPRDLLMFQIRDLLEYAVQLLEEGNFDEAIRLANGGGEGIQGLRHIVCL
ncbi:VPS41, partial [Symbiodinium microadriaticum]